MKLWGTTLHDINVRHHKQGGKRKLQINYSYTDTNFQQLARLDVGELLEVLALELPLKHTHICTVNFLACCFTDSCHAVLQYPSQQHLHTISNCLA